VWVLSFQNIIWFNLLFFPFFSVFGMIVIFLHFRFVLYRLYKWKVQPKESSNDSSIGYFIMVFMNLTFLLNVVSVLWLVFI